MRLPRSGAGWTIAVFGVLALLLGALGLLWPEVQLRMLGFEVPDRRAAGDYTGTFLTASSMASFNMGVYYLLAVATEWRAFYRFTVVFRLVTCTVFTLTVLADVAPGQFLGVALWEGLGAVATALGLRWDARRAGRDRPATTGVVDGPAAVVTVDGPESVTNPQVTDAAAGPAAAGPGSAAGTDR
ncbi:hypothetical protein GA0070560_11077 [Micromonospora halophytica]|uniref:DUF4345 domain-containing protein n=1 Tax=Micromonospora halophytica TaxID=47864 RepID=A0A1C5ICW3_9ACTN|nr:hypothetical protein [Micromonospora halophytica]SCG56242.1 hypothetical protein GA0070560_11077 [Micromonospora halophytica]